MFEEIWQLGPLTIQRNWLIIIIFLVCAYWLSLRVEKEAQNKVLLDHTLFYAVILFLGVWKLSSLLFRPLFFWQDPILLLYYPGTWKELAIALSVLCCWLLWKWRKSDVSAFSLTRSIAIFCVMLLLANVTIEILDTAQAKTSSNPGVDPLHGVKVGQIAPDFTLSTLNGESVTLSDLHGKKVIINFWATWCPPCRAEIPDIQRFSADYQDQVVVLAVNLTHTEKNKRMITDFMNQQQMTFPVLLDETGDIATMYQAIAIPTSYLLDENGIIIERKTGVITYEWLVKKGGFQ